MPKAQCGAGCGLQGLLALLSPACLASPVQPCSGPVADTPCGKESATAASADSPR